MQNTLQVKILKTIQECHHDPVHMAINISYEMLHHELELDGRYEMLIMIKIACYTVNVKSGLMSVEDYLNEMGSLAIEMWEHHCKLVGIMLN